MHLDENASVEVLLAGTVTTNELDWTADYAEWDPDDFRATFTAGQATGLTTGTSAAEIVGSAATGYVRKVTRISIVNTDTAAATITLRFNNGTTERQQYKLALAVGNHFEYSIDHGPRVVNTSGAYKTV